MSFVSPDSGLLEQFLQVVGVDRREPSIDALTEFVMGYMLRVPFENVSKLYYMKRHGLRSLPSLQQFLEGTKRNNFGGTCYSNNYYLHLVLTYLGFRVALCGAGMASPDVHLVNVVSVDEREFLVDAGYAAPFLEPLPLDLAQDYVITLGRDRYILKAKDCNGHSRVELYRDGQLKHGYTIDPAPRQIGHFTRVIDDSYHDSATFMNALLLVRLYPNRSIVIHNLSVIESEGADYHIHQLADRDELAMMVEKHFSIPRAIVSEAVAGLGEFGDAWD
jgi:arylamine N-acetyltransferase